MATSVTMHDDEIFELDVVAWLAQPGPIVTELLPAPSASEAAPEHLRQHAKSVDDALRGSAPDAALDAVAAALDDDRRAHAHGDALLVLAAADGTVALSGLPDEVGTGRGWCGELPRLGPVLEARQHVVPHVVVVADRVGADMTGRGSHRPPRTRARWTGPRCTSTRVSRVVGASAASSSAPRTAGSTTPPPWPTRSTPCARPSAPGSWWPPATCGPCSCWGEHAPPALVDVLVVHDGPGRGDADPFEAIAPEVERQVATVVANDTRAVMEHFDEVRAKGLAVEGPADVLELLSEARVDTLLVHDDLDDDRTGRARPRQRPGRPRGRRAPAAAWASSRWRPGCRRRHLGGAATGASLRFVPGHGPHAPEGGLGALLRG